jgi:hypothetical protein
MKRATVSGLPGVVVVNATDDELVTAILACLEDEEEPHDQAIPGQV